MKKYDQKLPSVAVGVEENHYVCTSILWYYTSML